MGKISSREELERWFADKPHQWTQVIAIRSALRALPYGLSDLVETVESETFVLALFRAASVGWSANGLPGWKSQDAAMRAARAVRAERTTGWQRTRRGATTYRANDERALFAARAIDAMAYAVARANDIAGVAELAEREERCNFIARGSFAAHAESYAAARNSWVVAPAKVHIESATEASALSWEAVSAECEWLTSRSASGASASALAAAPLWLDGRSTAWSTMWQKAANKLLLKEPGYQLWVDWYERRISGEKASFAIAGDTSRLGDRLVSARLIGTDDKFWDRGASFVTATIGGWIGQAADLASVSIFDLFNQGIEEGVAPIKAPDFADGLRIEAYQAFAALADALAKLNPPAAGIGHNRGIDLSDAKHIDLPIIAREIASKSAEVASELQMEDPDLKAATKKLSRLYALGTWLAPRGNLFADEVTKALAKAAVVGIAAITAAELPFLNAALQMALEKGAQWLDAIARGL